MPTTIDSLQIEIQSNSTSASAGIKDLAKSLGELKKSGTVTTAIKNLDRLSTSLRGFADASTASRSIGKLVGALERLKTIGSVTSVASSVTKLGSSLRSLENINVDDVAPKIERIATALQPLSGVKAGGINTMANGLSKLGKVTESLDDATIDAFAEKIKKLNTVLEPLSTKMTTIQTGLRGVSSKARSAGSSVKQMGNDINTAALNFSTITHSIQTVVQWLNQAIQKFAEIMNQAIEWDGIAARFGRGFGNQAQETYEWIQRLNEEMGINIQQFMQYSSIYATMLTGFGVAMEDATKMALGYTELTYDIWAGYNDIYKSYGEAADAVKSAIAGEVEPIRRAGFTIVESTLEQTAANYGLSISLEKATEAQKSYLRYLTLVDQAHAQNLVGTYAKELNTAEGLMRTFSQQLKSLTQAFGSLFLPILVKVMPYLQAFVELLTEGIQAFAALFGITIQGVDWSGYGDDIGGATSGTEDFTGSVGDATEAIKELKNAAIGIDELNVISPPTSSSGSGGGAGDAGFGNLDVDSLWDESIFADINKQVDDIKGKLEGWLPVIGTIGGVLGALGITTLLQNLGTAMAEMAEMEGKLATLRSLLAGLAILTIEAVLVFMLTDDYLETGNFMSLIGEALVTAAGGYLMYKGFGTKGLLLSLGVSIAAQLLAIGLNLADGGVEFSDPELWIQSAFTVALSTIAGGYLSYKGFTKLTTGKGLLLGLTTGIALTLATITMGEIAANGLSAEAIGSGLGAIMAGALTGMQVFSYLGWSTGKGLAIGALASVSLMLQINSVTTMNDADASIGEKITSALTSALSLGITGAGIGSMIAPGPGTAIGFAVGVGVSLVISIGSMIFGDDDDTTKFDWATEAKVDLERRFGEIDLTVDEIDVLVSKVSAITRTITIDGKAWGAAVGAMKTQSITLSVSAALEFYNEQKGKKASLEDAVEEALGKIEANNLKITLGIDVSPEDYKADVDSFVTNAQSLLDQSYLTASVAIDILGANTGLDKTLSTFYTTNSQKLANLGGRLKKTISEAFVDGEWIPDKLNEAMELQKEIQDVVNYIADVEYRAKLKSIDLELSSLDITEESFKEAMKKLNDLAAEGIKTYSDIKVDALKVAYIAYDMAIEKGATEAEAQKIFDQTVAEIQAKFDDQVVDVTLGGIDFGLSSLQEKFDAELDKYVGNFDWSKFSNAMLTNGYGGWKGEDPKTGKEIYYGLANIVDNMAANYKTLLEMKIPALREDILPLFEEMVPTLKELDGVATRAYSAGETVPENVRKGLNDAAELGALARDADAINYMLGMKFSTDDRFLNTLAIAEGAGAAIPKKVAKGFLTNVDYVTNAEGVIVGIKNAITGKVTEITPTLKKNLADMGVDVTSGLLEGATGEMKAKEKSWKDWAIWPWNWFKKENEINSPSKLFARGGKYLTDGLIKGMEQDSLSTKLSSIWGQAKSWWNTKKGNFNTYTPTIGSIKDKVSSAWTTAKSWWDSKKSNMNTYTPAIGNIATAVSSAWTNAKTWWNTKKSAMSTYTPPIGSISTKVASAWSSARTWWNTKKPAMTTYTPVIGSIKDKLSSAWGTAKKWWNNNVKLSIPSLSFKVTYTNSGLSTIQKGIVKAFGMSGWPKLSFAADGGIFDQGSLVWAGERGAEIVANAGGGKTGVMNVHQMQDAVYEGVYAAVVAAMKAGGGSNGSQAVNVYLDGRQVTAAVEQRQRERGVSLMGSQVYSY